MGAKKAVLFGCNYPGQKGELKGCINDVWNMKKILTELKGFEESNITVLIDTDSKYTSPTGANMRKALKDLVASAAADDILFVHYSGHGTQVPSFSEADWKNEALCPTDMNLIVDDDLRDIFNALPTTVQLTVVTDCCHSGGMLDHEAIIIDGDKRDDAASGKRDAPPDFNNRALPIDDVVEMLKKSLSAKGGKVPDSSNPRDFLGAAFPDDVSKYVTALAPQLGIKLTKEQERAAGGFLNSMFGACFGKKGAPAAGAAGPGATPVGDDEPAAGGGGGGGGAAPATPGKVEKPHVAEEMGVLITGCQSDETSADVRSGGTAFGALSNTLNDCLRKKPNATFRELVMDVRAELQQKGFKQNPCLECATSNADKPFIC